MVNKTDETFRGLYKYGFLVTVYLVAVVSSSISNSTGSDVQNLYRIPFLNIRWIDIAILGVLFNFVHSLTTTKKTLKNKNLIAALCSIYLIFEIFQLCKSWGLGDSVSQISLFFATLSLFIIIDLSIYVISIDKIIIFLKRFAIWGALTVIISNFYLIYSFFTGQVVYEDLDIRVALEVVGSKETVSVFVLTPFVYSFALYFIQKPNNFWIKTIYLCAILSIYGTLVVTLNRGSLAMILIITAYFLLFSNNSKQGIIKILGTFFFVALVYLIFGGAFSDKGYDPVNKIVQTIEFSTDINNPDWDKGRRGSQEYAIKAWEENVWTGAGYDILGHYGLPEGVATAHNGIITSLFHRGLLGTSILLTIIIVLYINALKLWRIIHHQRNEEDEMIKLLILVAFLWIIPFMTQEVLWEKYSLSIQLLFFGLITNIYKQKKIYVNVTNFKNLST